jgi:uncharacterized membrane protein
VRQVPPYLPFKHALAVGTGVLELVLSALLFVPSARRIAALGLIALLVAYVPAIVHMFSHDVLPAWPQPIRIAMRAIIFPHHLFLAWWLWGWIARDERLS